MTFNIGNLKDIFFDVYINLKFSESEETVKKMHASIHSVNSLYGYKSKSF